MPFWEDWVLIVAVLRCVRFHAWNREAVELFRKFWLTAGLVLVKPGSNIQLLLGLFVSAIFLVVFEHYEPMEDDTDDKCMSPDCANPRSPNPQICPQCRNKGIQLGPLRL